MSAGRMSADELARADRAELEDMREHVPFLSAQIGAAVAARDELVERSRAVYGHADPIRWPGSSYHGYQVACELVRTLEGSFWAAKEYRDELERRVSS